MPRLVDRVYEKIYKAIPYVFGAFALLAVTDICFGSSGGQWLYSKGKGVVNFRKEREEIRLGITPQTDSKYDKTIAQGLEGSIIAFTLWDVYQRRKINRENAKILI